MQLEINKRPHHAFCRRRRPPSRWPSIGALNIEGVDRGHPRSRFRWASQRCTQRTRTARPGVRRESITKPFPRVATKRPWSLAAPFDSPVRPPFRVAFDGLLFGDQKNVLFRWILHRFQTSSNHRRTRPVAERGSPQSLDSLPSNRASTRFGRKLAPAVRVSRGESV